MSFCNPFVFVAVCDLSSAILPLVNVYVIFALSEYRVLHISDAPDIGYLVCICILLESDIQFCCTYLLFSNHFLV